MQHLLSGVGLRIGLFYQEGLVQPPRFYAFAADVCEEDKSTPYGFECKNYRALAYYI